MTGEFAIWLTKLVHVAAIAVWVGGLVSVPFLLVQRHRLSGEAVHRLHRLVRSLHIQFVSPAAFVAIGTGIALIFLREVFFVWFTAKLYLVGLLVICHVLIGLLIVSTFEPEGRTGALVYTGLTGTTAAAALGVLYFVLAKPALDLGALTGAAFEPGGLEETIVGPLLAFFISLTK
jgi:protoporphyrinogen IX oxidase